MESLRAEQRRGRHDVARIRIVAGARTRNSRTGDPEAGPAPRYSRRRAPAVRPMHG
jgi:hypothetical protein